MLVVSDLTRPEALTAKKCPIATANPMARLAEPLRSARLGSQVAKMVKTSSKVMRSSTRRPCPTEI